MNGRSRQYFQHLFRSVWSAVLARFPCSVVRPLVQDCSGGITAIVGLSLGVLLMAFACATTLGEANVVKSDLQSAVDAAVLAGARSNDTTTKTTHMQSVFWLNFARNGASGGTGPGGSVATITSLEASDKTVSMTASATVSVIPYTHAFDLPVRASASAQASTTGVEMALVIDNTGSLGHSGMQATRDGAKALIEAVLPDDSVKDTWISIVPFGAVVNFGPTHTNWLSSSFNEEAYSPTSWEGCMMARTDGGHDRDDATPSEAPFDAFIYPSTYPQWGRFGWTYTWGGNSVVLASPSKGQKPGDNSWDRSNPASISETYNYPESPSYPGSSIYTSNASNPIGWFATGPNLGCPYQPIIPETSDQATLLAAIDNMRMVWRGGTMINTGLQAGWLTISSNWQGWWGTQTSRRLRARPRR
ncbi:hypothetical protein AA0472_1984 [Acetobacter estunensis NRIC 0472]|uniref:Putative Flp pilus-assembly TadG-like N-terminal domain-containing protein n=1 Tax=Acetobacter estunensis TaxID=104097 RepID=A0A967B3B8_9PROT|nr:Tad domain-containing protein [Acetobacter estunensis]NHO52469.1 hypothetical protein [Acetobacter estunensis]GBQ26061.1 hypothetical protein AA0472_1984 [Acetobacter estunensis NRIC 0472]